MRDQLSRYAGLIAGVAVLVLVLVLSSVHALRSLDDSSIDARFAIRGSQPPRDVVVVGIDTPTFNALPKYRFPYPRRLEARVITKLSTAGAKVIAVDLEFLRPTDSRDDNALILAVRHAGNVVLATDYVGPTGRTAIFGGPAGLAYSRAVAGMGLFPLDPDNVYRRMRDQYLGLHTVAVATAQLALGHALAFPGGTSASVPIDFAGPTGTVPEIPFSDVLSGHFSAAAVRGKIVVVGATAADLNDIHATATATAMSGPELQANAIQTALDRFPLRDAPGGLNALLIVVFSLAAPLLALRLGPLTVLGSTALGIGVLAVIAQLAFDGGTIIGFVYPAFAGILSAGATFALQGRRVRELERQVPSPVADYFISYRRGQSELAANMLRQGLVRRFGQQRVFMDTAAIDSGDRWPQRLDEAVAASRAVLVLIGPQWLDSKAPDGSRRIDDPEDWVRKEIEVALANEEATVVPVLYDGAEMPEREQLPPAVAPLTECQAVPLTGIDLDKWIDELDRSINTGRTRRFRRTLA